MVANVFILSGDAFVSPMAITVTCSQPASEASQEPAAPTSTNMMAASALCVCGTTSAHVSESIKLHITITVDQPFMSLSLSL